MSWFKVDDSFPEHPKLEELEREPLKYMAAVTVWTVMGADCARRLTDGVVTLSRLTKVLHKLGKHTLVGAEALCGVGLWERHALGYRYHDWRDYQPTKADVKKARRQKAERQQRWRQGRDGQQGASNDARVDALRDALVDASTAHLGDAGEDAAPTRDPIPSHPDPTHREKRSARARSEPPPLPEPPSDIEPSKTAVQLVREAYERRFYAATTNPPSWSARNLESAGVIGAWLEAKGGDAERILGRLLDGFFADEWVAKNNYPLGALATEPAKFLGPPRLRDVKRGFVPPAPAGSFTATDPDTVFGTKKP